MASTVWMRTGLSCVLLAMVGAWSSEAVAQTKKLFLNFSDGTEELVQGTTDDATANVSRLCGAAPLLSWSGAQDCENRDECVAQIADLVQEHWRDFNVEITVHRPAENGYAMAMIGPATNECQFGVQGLADVDCNDQTPSNIALAFDCSNSVLVCAGVISHELGHGFGLVHGMDPEDIMYGGVTNANPLEFLDASTKVVDPDCGVTIQNSHAWLTRLLGVWPSGKEHPKDWETNAASQNSDEKSIGCALSRRLQTSSPWECWLVLLVCACRRVRKGIAAVASKAPSRP